MLEISKGVYTISLLLKPDEYQYKFLEDGMKYITDKNANSFVDEFGDGYNQMTLKGPNVKPKDYIIKMLSILNNVKDSKEAERMGRIEARDENLPSKYLVKKVKISLGKVKPSAKVRIAKARGTFLVS